MSRYRRMTVLLTLPVFINVVLKLHILTAGQIKELVGKVLEEWPETLPLVFWLWELERLNLLLSSVMINQAWKFFGALAKMDGLRFCQVLILRDTPE
ncbi:GSCOCG00007560001-RA-CDS [Cotesia congregata]|nr:GSCOCG00007560001-RA-CDS [Cotesia congregata]